MNDTFAALFASGHAVDVVLLVLVAEAIWLVARRRADALPALLPGALILLALRAALTGAPWWAVAGWLALSLPAHLYDLRRRLRASALTVIPAKAGTHLPNSGDGSPLSRG